MLRSRPIRCGAYSRNARIHDGRVRFRDGGWTALDRNQGIRGSSGARPLSARGTQRARTVTSRGRSLSRVTGPDVCPQETGDLNNCQPPRFCSAPKTQTIGVRGEVMGFAPEPRTVGVRPIRRHGAQ